MNDLVEAWRDVHRVLDAIGSYRVFMDVTALKNCPEAAEWFDLAKLLWRDFPQGGRIALVVRWDQSRFAKLLERLVLRVGSYLAVFASEEQAEAWILGSSQDKYRLPGFNSVPKAC